MSALKEYRSKGEQKMTVQHVRVAEGGQAIVGNVNATPEGVGGAHADARICLLAYYGQGRRRHAPARHGEFAHAVHRGADDRSGIIGKDAGQHRQVAREVAHRDGEVAVMLYRLHMARSVSLWRGEREAWRALGGT
jgi:hypothetical protein